MSDTKLLLTPARKMAVEKALLEACKVAEAHYGMPFELPEIWYDVKNTDGGRANYGKWLVRFNLILMVENEEKFLATTVKHEMAHLITHRVYHKALAAEGKKLRPHGKQWKEVMGVLNIPAKVCHSYPTTSIQRQPRRKRGAKLKGPEAEMLLKRLISAVKRLPKRHVEFMLQATALHLEDLS